MKEKKPNASSLNYIIESYYQTEKIMDEIEKFLDAKHKKIAKKKSELPSLENLNETYCTFCLEILELYLHVFLLEHYYYKQEPVNQIQALRHLKIHVSSFILESGCKSIIPDYIISLEADIAKAERTKNTFSIIDSEFLDLFSRDPWDISDEEFLLITLDNMDMVKGFSQFLKTDFSTIEEPSTKLKWNIQAEKFGNLFIVLANENYFDLPSYHGEGAYQTLANLLFAFMDVNGTTLDNLRRVLNPTKNTSYIKNPYIFSFPDIKSLKKK